MRKLTVQLWACCIAALLFLTVSRGFWNDEPTALKLKLEPEQEVLVSNNERQPEPHSDTKGRRKAAHIIPRFSLQDADPSACGVSEANLRQLNELEDFWNDNYKLSDLAYFSKTCDNPCAIFQFQGTLPKPDESKPPSYENLELKYGSKLQDGGVYRPSAKECASPQKVAVIVPFRDRDAQFRLLLDFLHSFLPKQQVEYRVVLAEQEAGTSFNRGILFNAAFRELRKLDNSMDCLILHDVDMQPVDDRTLYRCSDTEVTHLAERVDKLMQPVIGDIGTEHRDDATWEEINNSSRIWQSSWPSYFGGVVAVTTAHYEALNGFSNVYFGWGAEDDDLLRRIKARHIEMRHYGDGVNRFRTLRQSHVAARPNEDRFRIFHEVTHALAPDGLVDIAGYYKAVVSVTRLFTHVRVRVDESAVRLRWYLPKAFDTGSDSDEE